MTEVYHNAAIVHLLDHFFAERRHSIMGIAATGAIANIVISIVAKCYICHPALRKVLHVGDIAPYGQAVLYA